MREDPSTAATEGAPMTEDIDEETNRLDGLSEPIDTDESNGAMEGMGDDDDDDAFHAEYAAHYNQYMENAHNAFVNKYGLKASGEDVDESADGEVPASLIEGAIP